MEMTADRLKHSLAVAKKMKTIAFEKPELYPVDPEDMFILGILHDIGYEYCSIQSDHAKVGGKILEKQGYHYWKEVFYHGIPQNDYDSAALRLLNYADLITGPKGEDFTVQQRIEDIVERYGSGSIQETEAKALVEMMRGYI